MPIAEKILAVLQRRVQTALENAGGGHDWDHTLRVVRNAGSLADALPEADRSVVLTAAWLHDVARPLETAGKGTPDHAEAGAETAYGWLLELGCEAPFAEAVRRCILRHRYRSGRRPETLEERIVYDADKLDGLGAVGIGRAFLFAGREGARLHNTAEEALAAPPYSREDTAYREYLVKLRKIPEALLTEPAKRRAAGLVQMMAEFFAELDREVYGG